MDHRWCSARRYLLTAQRRGIPCAGPEFQGHSLAVESTLDDPKYFLSTTPWMIHGVVVDGDVDGKEVEGVTHELEA